MKEQVYTAEAELVRPGRFLRSAASRLRRAAPAAWTMVRSNIRAQSRRSALGYAWLVLPTLATAVVCLAVRANGLIAVQKLGIPYPAFVLSGLTAWQVFVDAVNAPLTQLAKSRGMLTRSALPHETVLLAGALEALFNGVVRVAVILPLLFLIGVAPSWSLWLAPVATLALVAAGTAVGVILAPVGLLYDDIRGGLPLALAFWLFLSPVFYPVHRSGALAFNPVGPLVETFRAALTGGAAAPGFALVSGAAILLLGLGWLVYELARPHVVERLG